MRGVAASHHRQDELDRQGLDALSHRVTVEPLGAAGASADFEVTSLLVSFPFPAHSSPDQRADGFTRGLGRKCE